MHRYQTHGPIEVENQRDPTQEVGNTVEEDQHNTTITLAIVLTAFIISPMTECLGPVLELNVSLGFASFRSEFSVHSVIWGSR